MANRERLPIRRAAEMFDFEHSGRNGPRPSAGFLTAASARSFSTRPRSPPSESLLPTRRSSPPCASIGCPSKRFGMPSTVETRPSRDGAGPGVAMSAARAVRASLLRDAIFEALEPVEHDRGRAHCLQNDDDVATRYHLKRVVECVKAAAATSESLRPCLASGRPHERRPYRARRARVPG